MRHTCKSIMAAALLWGTSATGLHAQMVINYLNDKATQETTTDNLVKVDKNGNSYLLNQLDISRINYIARFITANTNEGCIKLPTGAPVKAGDLVVVGGNEVVPVDDNGNFRIEANYLTAYDQQGRIIYRSYVTFEAGEQMRLAVLNAEETAVSLLIPMFNGMFTGASDEATVRLKQLIGSLTGTEALAQAIDQSIISNGYLNMDDIEGEYAAAVLEVAKLSGLEQASQTRRPARGKSMIRLAPSVGDKAVAEGITAELKQLEKVEVPRPHILLSEPIIVKGYRGTFSLRNANRQAYSRVVPGMGTLESRLIPVFTGGELNNMLPPVSIAQLVNASSTWDDIKGFLTGDSGSASNAESLLDDVTIDFSYNNDGLMVVGPGDEEETKLYNMNRIYMSMVVADMIGASDNSLTDLFFKAFSKYLYGSYYAYWFVDNSENPERPESVVYEQEFRKLYDQESPLTDDERAVKFFEITFKVLQKFVTDIKSGAFPAEDIAGIFTNASVDKVLGNYDFYLSMVRQIGGKTTGLQGMDEGTTDLHVDGLDIEQPKPTEQDIRKEGIALYDKYVALGNGKDSYTNNIEFFYKTMWLPGVTTTLDSQSIGWEASWQRQEIHAEDLDQNAGFDGAYGIISYANTFLDDLLRSGLTNFGVLEGEARALRAFAYIYLAENWGRVPLRDAGQTLENIQSIPYPDTEMEVWDFIIADLKKAADLLDWQPRDGIKGRCTKGMALSYMGEAYLWVAYRQRANGQEDEASITAARDALKKVIDSNQYTLARSYSTLWDGYEAWPDEAIWQFANELNPNPESIWARYDWTFMNFYAAAPVCGGWGSMYNSWELYFLFEQGDKRRDASLCTAAVPSLPEQYRSVGYGKNPFMQQTINANTYKFENGEYPPAVWTMKHWRLQRCQWSSPYSPTHIYFKRYANVLLDYAECLFRLNGGNDAEAWGLIDRIRNRAFGNDEPTFGDQLTQQHIAYYNLLASFSWISDYRDYHTITSYPIPFNEQVVQVEPAKDYYTNMTSEGLKINLTGTPETLCLPFSGKAEPWQVALGQERRKEFNDEWCLRADLQRMDFMQAHMDCNYPKDLGSAFDANNWHTVRTWDFNPQRMILPLPQYELQRNSHAIQNPK